MEKIIYAPESKNESLNIHYRGLDSGRRETREGREALRITPVGGEAAAMLALETKENGRDWSAYTGIAVEAFNPGKRPVVLWLRLNSMSEDGKPLSAHLPVRAAPGVWSTLRFFAENKGVGPFWGMAGTPVGGSFLDRMMAKNLDLNMRRVWSLEIILRSATPGMQSFMGESASAQRVQAESSMLIGEVTAFDAESPLSTVIPLPFVDRYGQNKHRDFDGKIASDAQLEQARTAEDDARAGFFRFPQRDEFGGWAEGPQLEATGWFRVEKLGNCWWFVTPGGRLFLSLGVDVVSTWNDTFVDGRGGWYDWLPQEDARFVEATGHFSGALYCAEKIGGTGRTANFYRANLIRKYGPKWKARWSETAFWRLQSWGFNTVACWSDPDLYNAARLPFTLDIRSTLPSVAALPGGDSNALETVGKMRRIESASGLWGTMYDVFDESFAAGVETAVKVVAGHFSKEPMCIGYFMDNELSWGDGIVNAALDSPPAQPARHALIERLEAKHGSIEKVNSAWGTDAADWDALRIPPEPNAACREDREAFLYDFARRYFELIAEAIRKYAPNQLYLGCRFMVGSAPACVLRACTEFVDVVSANLYGPEPPTDPWNKLGKPVVITEFTFSASDANNFGTGFMEVQDQAERAQSLRDYVSAMIKSPAFIGCHWFQYPDESITGRPLDGFNSNFGLVNVADIPHAEVTTAAREVFTDIYTQRYTLHAGPGSESQ